jgi:hypothetical protein
VLHANLDLGFTGTPRHDADVDDRSGQRAEVDMDASVARAR